MTRPDDRRDDYAAPGHNVDIESISPVAQDYLKVIWSATEWGDSPITSKALAERFGTTAANITDTVKRLAAQGLVRYEPYKPVELTEAGERAAIQMVRRHRLIESFLVTTLGYGWDEVHNEAERLEHAATDLLIDRIDALLGHPVADPHGDPIPSRTGTTSVPGDASRLSAATPGDYIVTRISDDDPDRLALFSEYGLAPGTAVVVSASHAASTVVEVLGHPDRSLDHNTAAAVWVIPGNGPAHRAELHRDEPAGHTG